VTDNGKYSSGWDDKGQQFAPPNKNEQFHPAPKTYISYGEKSIPKKYTLVDTVPE